jgi:hypothetical protein
MVAPLLKGDYTEVIPKRTLYRFERLLTPFAAPAGCIPVESRHLSRLRKKAFDEADKFGQLETKKLAAESAAAPLWHISERPAKGSGAK